MSTGCGDIAKLLEAAHALVVYRDTIDKWLNGTETEDVTLGGVSVPTLRKMAATIDERESRAAQEVIDEGVSAVVAIKNSLLELAEEVSGKVENIVGITATATILPEGAAPTAAYDRDTGALVLGIPAGATGKTGPAGPPGQAPAADVIDCGGASGARLTILDGGSAVTAWE